MHIWVLWWTDTQMGNVQEYRGDEWTYVIRDQVVLVDYAMGRKMKLGRAS